MPPLLGGSQEILNENEYKTKLDLYLFIKKINSLVRWSNSPILRDGQQTDRPTLLRNNVCVEEPSELDSNKDL